jgi:A/G-specific adenine glycosylase
MTRKGRLKSGDTSPHSKGFASAAKRTLRRNLLSWFRRHARDLPWRRTCDPYRIWVSEIMLQQTQVATVVPYFERFIARFPSVRGLAEAREQDVLRLWEGLGYYRRARQLHEAARAIVAQHGGEIPRDADALRSLPGIGRYTAGAILSLACDQREPILEANSIRVLSRLAAFRGDPNRSAGRSYLWTLAAEFLPTKGAGAFNQALMELGSEICTPRNPACDRCPLRTLCPTRAKELQHVIPLRKKKTRYQDVREAVVIIERRGKLLLRRNGADERWAGLWDYPRFSLSPRQGAALRTKLAAGVKRLTGLTVRECVPWTTLKHGVTRFRITLACYKAGGTRGRVRPGPSSIRWVKLPEVAAYPQSRTGRRISDLLLAERNGGPLPPEGTA